MSWRRPSWFTTSTRDPGATVMSRGETTPFDPMVMTFGLVCGGGDGPPGLPPPPPHAHEESTTSAAAIDRIMMSCPHYGSFLPARCAGYLITIVPRRLWFVSLR